MLQLLNSSLLLIICLGLSLAQTYRISGLVLDSKTKEPLENTNVYIHNSDIGTVTDHSGYFVLYLDDQVKEYSKYHKLI